ncbi:MAG: DUF1836 domain-containing protein [Eubacteriales bacterium]|nr:DUF1836 domain-containing protein [Eubacteriales bacterium]
MTNEETYKELLKFLNTIHYVKPEQIPEIALYMDQVTGFMEDRLKKVKRYPDDKILTKTMINNYTKAKILPAPIKKKYSKEHMYMLLLIYYYKGILSLDDLNTVLFNLTNNYFKPDDSEADFNVEAIYREVFTLETEQMQALKKDIAQKFEHSKSTFTDGAAQNLSEAERDRLQKFAFICELGFDVYLKKLLMEKLCDQLKEEQKGV